MTKPPTLTANQHPMPMDGLAVGSALRAWAVRAAAAVWQSLEAYGSVRAARQLSEIARRFDRIDPERARQLHEASRFIARANAAPRTRAEEAAFVRALADRHRRTDRGFADDLVAAANRHESAAGG